MTCNFCENTLINKEDTTIFQLIRKFCHQCKIDFAICFCDKICDNVIKSSNESLHCEYLTCKTCSYLGVRCVVCKKICEIAISSPSADYPNCLYWKCNNCKSFRGRVERSFKNHVDEFKDKAIDAEFLCCFILRYVDTFTFKHLLCSLISSGRFSFEEARISLVRKYAGNNQILQIIEECSKKITPLVTENVGEGSLDTSQSRDILAQIPPIGDLVDSQLTDESYQHNGPVETESFIRFFNDLESVEAERINQLEKNYDNFVKDVSLKLEEINRSLMEYKEISDNKIADLNSALKIEVQSLNEFKSIMDENVVKINDRMETKLNKLERKFEDVSHSLEDVKQSLNTFIQSIQSNQNITNLENSLQIEKERLIEFKSLTDDRFKNFDDHLEKKLINLFDEFKISNKDAIQKETSKIHKDISLLGDLFTENLDGKFKRKRKSETTIRSSERLAKKNKK